jgi:glyoxylase-like metal-dependent hydrolase (beta-lactamase superfamily II)
VKKQAAGYIHERVTAIGGPAYPAYVVRGDSGSLMIDSGINHLGPLYAASLEQLLGDDGHLDYLFLTHFHYDHAGSAGYLKQRLPGLRIGAHERAAALAQKPTALDDVNRLSMSHTELFHLNRDNEDVTVRPFEIDLLLGQDDRIDLGGVICHVYETPGHTKESLSFFFPEIGVLFPGDACGVLRTGPSARLQVGFVTSYEAYVDSLRSLIALRPEIVCLAHNWVFTDTDAGVFLDYSLAETFRYRTLIESHLDAVGGDVDEAVRRMVQAELEAEGDDSKLPAGHFINLAVQVKHIAGLRTR